MSPFDSPPEVVGHRGAPDVAPENTPVSFAAAADAGATWVELDARRAADDVLVVHHDARTPDGVEIFRRSADELAHLGVWSLEAALDALPDGIGVDVEVKNHPGEPDHDEEQRVASAVVGLLAGRVAQRPWMTSSFNPLAVERLASGLPHVPAGLLHTSGARMASMVPIALELGARVLCPQVGSPDLDAAGIATAHAEGLPVLVWTVDDLGEATRLAGAGVDALCTNTPAALVAHLRALRDDGEPARH